MCWRCDMADAFARREYDAATRATIDRGRDRVTQYMEEHGVSFPEAVEGLAEERRAEYAELAANYAERHGLDDQQTRIALWAHGIDGTGSIQ